MKHFKLIALIALCGIANVHCAERIIFQESPRLLTLRHYSAIAGIGACTYAAYRKYSNWVEEVNKNVKEFKKDVSKFTTNHAPQFYLTYDYGSKANTFYINIWLQNKNISEIFNTDSPEANRKFFEEVKEAIAKRKLLLIDHENKRVRPSDIKPDILILAIAKSIEHEGQKLYELLSKKVEINEKVKEVKEKYGYLLEAFLQENQVPCLESLVFDNSLNEKLQNFENRRTIKSKKYDYAFINEFFDKSNAEHNERVKTFCKLVVMYLKLYALDMLINDVKTNLGKYGIDPRKVDVSIGSSSSLIGKPYFPEFMRHHRDPEA